jgi:hypothetical protein
MIVLVLGQLRYDISCRGTEEAFSYLHVFGRHAIVHTDYTSVARPCTSSAAVAASH